jgi:lipid-binding SYLF domain-containing protein
MSDDFKFPSMAPVPLMVKDLTMRDHFAGFALQGMLANIDEEARRYMHRQNIEASEVIAKASWEMADAMLKMRGEK